MREAFLADATDLFERIENLVVGLDSQRPREAIHELARCFHTLKGAAGSVGLSELATLVHELEERLGQASGRRLAGLNDLLHQVVGYLDELIGLLAQQARAQPTGSAPRVGDRGRSRRLPRPGCLMRPPSPTRDPAAEGPIRVPAARFDELTDLASELIVQGRFWLSQAESIKTFAATVQGVPQPPAGQPGPAARGRPGARGPEAPPPVDPQADLPAQLRRLAEQADDLTVLAASAQAAAGFDGRPRRYLGPSLTPGLGLVPIAPDRPHSGPVPPPARVLHDAARVEGRQVEVVMKGEETGVDRAVQDKAFEPLLHVVRNAVGHGIESPADRVRAGKPATGCVTLEARREGNTLVIAVETTARDWTTEPSRTRPGGWAGCPG